MRSLERIVSLLPCSSVCLSLCLGQAYIVIIRCADLSLWLHSRLFWAPWHQNMSAYSKPSFSSSIWKRGGVWLCKLGVVSQERLTIEVKLLLSANRKSYIPRRLAQQRMIFSDPDCLKSTALASRAISALTELFVSVSLLCLGCMWCFLSCFWLSVTVQSIARKDSSPKWPITCRVGRWTYSLTRSLGLIIIRGLPRLRIRVHNQIRVTTASLIWSPLRPTWPIDPS